MEPSVDPGQAKGRRAGTADRILPRMAGNAFILLSGKSLNAVMSLGTMALAVRALGLESYGVLVLIHTFAVAIAEIGKFQCWQAILYYGTAKLEAGQLADFRRLVRFSLLLDVGSAVLAMALAVVGGWQLGPLLGWPPEAVTLGALYGVSALLLVGTTPTGLLRLYDRFDLLAIQNSLGALVRLLGAGIAFLADAGLAAFLLVWFAGVVASRLSLFAFAWREVCRRGHTGQAAGGAIGWRGLTRPFAGIWRFVWLTNLNASAHLGFVHLGTLLTGGLLGSAEAGLFRIARQVAAALAKPARLLVQVIYPEFARLVAAGRMDRLRRLLLQSAGLAAGGAAVCLLVLVLAGSFLLELIGGASVQAAYPILLWLGVAALIDLWAFPLEPALISVGRAGTALAVRAGTLALFVPLLLVAVAEWGLIGVGFATLAASALLLVSQLIPTLNAVRRRAVA